VCSKLMHVLLERTALHEQGPTHNVLIMCSSCNVSQLTPCIEASKRKYLGGLFHHPVEERTNTKKRNNKKTCQATILEGLDVNRNKGICKVR
jgi:hypothetical protein